MNTEGLNPEFWKNGKFGGSQNFASKVLFGQTRDDVEVERWLVQMHGNVRRALVITSGGCGALTLLDVVCEEILTVDINPAQNRLAELKFAAWGRDGIDLETLFLRDGREEAQRLWDDLPLATRSFWGGNTESLRNGLLHCGQLDRFSAGMRNAFFGFVHSERFVRDFLSMNDVGAQQKVFREDWNTRRWRTALWLGFHPLLLRLTFSGVAAKFLPREFSSIMAGRLQHWLTAHPAASNPHLWQSYLREFPPARVAWPRYFQWEFHRSWKGTLGKISVVDGDVMAVLDSQREASLEFVSLSNVLELIPNRDAILRAASRSLRPGGLLLSRAILPLVEMPRFPDWVVEDRLLANASAMDRGGLSMPGFVLSRR